MTEQAVISLRGVRVHNLKGINLDIPRGQLIVICGVSGSGKSSLALDTLYAEGQRRYIESFSAYTRQFLQRLERPAADAIEGICPAIAVTGRQSSRSNRSTVGTATEIGDYLRLLFAKIGRPVCPDCQRAVQSYQPHSVAEVLSALPEGRRILITFALEVPDLASLMMEIPRLREQGFVRLLAGTEIVDISTAGEDELYRQLRGVLTSAPDGKRRRDIRVFVVVDRLVTGQATRKRLRDSLELAFGRGSGTCDVFMEEAEAVDASLNGFGPLNSRESTRLAVKDLLPRGEGDNRPTDTSAEESGELPGETAAAELPPSETMFVQGRPFARFRFSDRMRCGGCGREFPAPEPRLFSFNHPLGACPQCEGFGDVVDIDLDLIVPDKQKSIRQGAIAPWNFPHFQVLLDELLEVADEYDLPVDVPFSQLEPRHIQILMDGIPEKEVWGLKDFFAWLERKKYKVQYRIFLNRWRSYRRCPSCGGRRFRPEVLAFRVGGKNIAEISCMTVAEALRFFRQLKLSQWERQVARAICEQIVSRLEYLVAVGLGYLTLDRPLRTLSGGELRRVALTAALGASLVNMLYVLDEPSVGLHPRDIGQLIQAIRRLRDLGNTVIVVEHDPSVILSADQVIEIGPGAGEKGGEVVFQGSPRELLRQKGTVTGEWLSGRRRPAKPAARRPTTGGWITLVGACGNNLKNITVAFPLRVLCLVTGVSGSGKSTLVQDTLYPALCRRLGKPAPKPYPFESVNGVGQIEDVILVDQSPIGRTPRSNPVTYLKIFDEIRQLFADTSDARIRGFGPGHFSGNVEAGRCPTCQGEGNIEVPMQFLADVYVTCPDCQGKRYRPEILEVTFRGRNIAEVLEMTVAEAYQFFHGFDKIREGLEQLIDVGLDYIRLGQPANTLSGGESQRLKLAAYLSSVKKPRTLFILDEPTTGLHEADVAKLCECFRKLLDLGHSLIVVEHSLHMMAVADYIIDLGPGAADEGGQVVAAGTPEEIAACPQSITGRYLAPVLAGETYRMAGTAR
ncbi:MAG: excinuclease ABC subunit UvrA [Thermoguttaceae bacterium]|nr:excinuclease ABC subunit UvrA [Thermoguttaceae bacterium]MDW8079194.1 excinuclease ABC subunit UvrA [Thermoguttaceae bacterium]